FSPERLSLPLPPLTMPVHRETTSTHHRNPPPTDLPDSCGPDANESPLLLPDITSSPRAMSRSSSREQLGPRASTCTSRSSYDDERNDRVHMIADSLTEVDEMPEFHKYFLGLKTAEEAAAATEPTSMRLYYQLPIDGSIPAVLPLFLVYQSSKQFIFHFPIVEEAGRWRVKYGESKMVSYPSIQSLLLHHIHYAIVSPFDEGELESFEVWRTYTHI
ncbi:hypothetical protein PENTCL1PPCAC_12501, partial [Pristionchus entomophagus]